MPATLIQICSEASAEADTCVAAVADLLGLSVASSRMSSGESADWARLVADSDEPRAIAVSGVTLRGLLTCGSTPRGLEIESLLRRATLLVYGFPLEPHDCEVLSGFLASGSALRTEPVPPGKRTYFFDAGIKDSPLAAGSFECQDSGSLVAFCKGEISGGAKTLVSVNDRPLLICATQGTFRMYWLSEAPTLNVQALLVPPREPRDYYSAILPVSLALQQIFSTACWHNPCP